MLKYIFYIVIVIFPAFYAKSQHSIQGFTVTQSSTQGDLYNFDINYTCNTNCSPANITFTFDNSKLSIKLPDAQGVLQNAQSPAVLPITCNTSGGNSNTWFNFTGNLIAGNTCDGEQIRITATLSGANCTDATRDLLITASVEDKWVVSGAINRTISNICHDGSVYYNVTAYQTVGNVNRMGINLQNPIFSMDMPVCADIEILPLYGYTPIVSFAPINATLRRMTWQFPPQVPFLAVGYNYTWQVKIHYDCLRCLTDVPAFNPNLVLTGSFNCPLQGPVTHTNLVQTVENIPTISLNNPCPKDCDIDLPIRFKTELRNLNHFCPDDCLGTYYGFYYDNRTIGTNIGVSYQDFGITYEVPDGVILDGASWGPPPVSIVGTRILVELNQQPGTWVIVPPATGYRLCDYYLNGNKINRIRFEYAHTFDANGSRIDGFPIGTVVGGGLSLRLNPNLPRAVTHYVDSTCSNIQRQFTWTRSTPIDPTTVQINQNPNPSRINPILPLPVNLSPSALLLGTFTFDAATADSCSALPKKCCTSVQDTLHPSNCYPSVAIQKAVFDPATGVGNATYSYANIGEIRRYRLYVYNEANVAVNDFNLQDIIDPRLTYIPNSISWAALRILPNGSNYPGYGTALNSLTMPASGTGTFNLTTFNNHVCNVTITEPSLSNNQTFSMTGLDLPPSCIDVSCVEQDPRYLMFLFEFSVQVNASTPNHLVLPGTYIPNTASLNTLPPNNQRGPNPTSNTSYIVIPTPPVGLRIDGDMQGACKDGTLSRAIYAKAGDNVTFSMVLTNSGSYPLSNIEISNLRPTNVAGSSILNAPASLRIRTDFDVLYNCNTVAHTFMAATTPNPTFSYNTIGNNLLCSNCPSTFQYQCVTGTGNTWSPTCNNNAAWLKAEYNSFILNPGESITITFEGQVANNATIGGENYTSFFITGIGNGKSFCFESNLLKITITQDGCGRTPPPPATSCCKIPLVVEEKGVQNGRLSDEGEAYGYAMEVPISAGSSQITEIRASVVGFEMEYENEDCTRCFTPYNLIGTLVENQPVSFKKLNLKKGLTRNKVKTASQLAPNANRELIWTAPTGQPITLNTQLPLMLYIPKPRSLDCCQANAKVCIKFVVKDIDCNFCEKTACFEVKIPGKM